jgi:hypothetical protein
MIYELVKSIDVAAVIEKIVPQSKYFADILLLNKKKIVEITDFIGSPKFIYINCRKIEKNQSNKKVTHFANLR